MFVRLLTIWRLELSNGGGGHLKYQNYTRIVMKDESKNPENSCTCDQFEHKNHQVKQHILLVTCIFVLYFSS